MRRLSGGVPVNIRDEDPEEKQRKEISDILRSYLIYQTERNMRSFDFLRSLERAKHATTPAVDL
jgi:hypothetical protein